MDWLTAPLDRLAVLALSVIGVYVALVVLTRLSGLRSFSKMSGFDFAVTVAIGSVIAGTVLAPDPPLFQGISVLAFLFAIQMGVAKMRVQFPSIRGFSDNTPRLIMVRDQILHEQLHRAKITEDDLLGKLRESNVLDFSQIEAVVAETTGDISVLHRTEGEARLNPKLLEGVIGLDDYKSVFEKDKAA